MNLYHEFTLHFTVGALFGIFLDTIWGVFIFMIFESFYVDIGRIAVKFFKRGKRNLYVQILNNYSISSITYI